MGFLDSLKALFTGVDVDLGALEKADIKSEVRLVRDVKDNALVKVVKNDNSKTTHNHVNINLAADFFQVPGNAEKLQEIVRDRVHEESQPVMLAETAQLAEVVLETSEAVDAQLEKYIGKIPDSDLPILRAALHLREQHKAGEPVDGLKRDIADTYGRRGSNIANLCTAGYFESYVWPMYEELLARPNFTRQRFLDTYNRVVEDAPFAMFIGRYHTEAKIIEEITEKLRLNKRYGVHQMNIHTIGADNVRKIESALKNDAVRELCPTDPEITIQGKVATYSLYT